MTDKQFSAILNLLTDLLTLTQIAFWDKKQYCFSDFDSHTCEPCQYFRYCRTQASLLESLKEAEDLKEGG